MARKETLLYNVVPAGTSMASAVTSAPTVIRFTDNVSYVINVLTTDSIGSFVVEVSDNYKEGPVVNTENPGTWLPLDLSDVPIVNANDKIIGISLNQLPYHAIRLVYTPSTPGTGTFSADITSKSISG